MNIVLINHYAGSPKHGMEYRPFFFAREWVRAGHSVTIVAASFSHLRNQQPAVTGLSSEEVIDGVRYLWVRTPRYFGNGVARVINMLAFLTQILRLTLRLKRTLHPDLVISSSTYPLDAIPAWILARLSKARFIHEVHDLWPLTPIELGSFSRRHPFVMSMQIAEDFAYRRADWVVSMLPNSSSYMESRGMNPAKFVYVPNGIDPIPGEASSTKEIVPHDSIVARLKAEGRFVVMYAGSHGLANALEILPDVAEALRSEPVSFVLVGKGPLKEELRNECARRGLTSVTFLDYIERAQVPALLSRADALFLAFRRSSLYRFGVCPNKLFDYMLSGRPIVQALEAANDLVSDAQCGITIPPEDPAAMADAIRHLMGLSEQKRAEMGERGRVFVLANHAYPNLAARFPEIKVTSADSRPFEQLVQA